jgi:hypothetical protein
MDDELDRLLQTPLLTPPPDFALRVMRRVQHLRRPERPSPWRSALEWLTLAAAGIPATLRLLAFVFNMWAAAAAG